MNFTIAENTPIRTIQTLITEAKTMGLRVVHRPTVKDSNVVSILEARRVMLANVSAEA